MSILTQTRILGIVQLLPISFFVLASGCAYRFTNTAVRPPSGIQTLAVEAVWDNSREVIPHELLWSAVQREIIRNGRVTLTNQDEADALMVVSIVNAKVSPVGVPSEDGPNKDPEAPRPDTNPLPGNDQDNGNSKEYRRLGVGQSITKQEGLTFKVHVNVYDLKSRALLFNRDYSSGATFLSLPPVEITPTESQYLYYQEALQARFKAASDSMAHSIVNDFLM